MKKALIIATLLFGVTLSAQAATYYFADNHPMGGECGKESPNVFPGPYPYFDTEVCYGAYVWATINDIVPANTTFTIGIDHGFTWQGLWQCWNGSSYDWCDESYVETTIRLGSNNVGTVVRGGPDITVTGGLPAGSYPIMNGTVPSGPLGEKCFASGYQDCYLMADSGGDLGTLVISAASSVNLNISERLQKIFDAIFGALGIDKAFAQAN